QGRASARVTAGRPVTKRERGTLVPRFSFSARNRGLLLFLCRLLAALFHLNQSVSASINAVTSAKLVKFKVTQGERHLEGAHLASLARHGHGSFHVIPDDSGRQNFSRFIVKRGDLHEPATLIALKRISPPLPVAIWKF